MGDAQESKGTTRHPLPLRERVRGEGSRCVICQGRATGRNHTLTPHPIPLPQGERVPVISFAHLGTAHA
jgi:hypothetical protein